MRYGLKVCTHVIQNARWIRPSTTAPRKWTGSRARIRPRSSGNRWPSAATIGVNAAHTSQMGAQTHATSRKVDGSSIERVATHTWIEVTRPTTAHAQTTAAAVLANAPRGRGRGTGSGGATG